MSLAGSINPKLKSSGQAILRLSPKVKLYKGKQSGGTMTCNKRHAIPYEVLRLLVRLRRRRPETWEPLVWEKLLVVADE